MCSMQGSRFHRAFVSVADPILGGSHCFGAEIGKKGAYAAAYTHTLDPMPCM